MIFYLARHGETDWNQANRIQGQTDTLLNENGRRQAASLAQAISSSSRKPEIIYTSNRKRAVETACIVGKILKLPICQLPGVEEMHLGEWEGYTWPQVRQLYPEEYARWYAERGWRMPPGGESYQMLLQRVVPAMGSLLTAPYEEVLVVTHSAVIMTLLSAVYDKPFEDMVKNFHTGNAETVTLTGEQLLPLVRTMMSAQE